MMLVYRDNKDFIQASIEFMLVNKQGKMEPYGKYVFVNQLEINPGVNGRTIIKYFIDKIATTYPWTIAGYWERRDKKRSRLRTYTREQLLRRWRNEVPVMVMG